MSRIVLHERIAPADTPAADTADIFLGFDKALYLKNDDGDVVKVADTLGIAGWARINGQVLLARAGAAAPVLTAFGPTGVIKMPAFAIGDIVYIQFKMPPTAKVDGLHFAAIDFTTDGTDVNTVKFQVTHTKALVGGVFPADTVATFEAAPSGVAWEVVQILGTEIADSEPELMVVAEVKRITNGGTDNTDEVFPVSYDLWYEVDKTVAEDHPT